MISAVRLMVRAPRWLPVVMAVMLSLTACAQQAGSRLPETGLDLAPVDSWQSPLYTGHPLVGTIWSGREGRPISVSALAENLVNSRYLLLGEKHDNPDHHRIQQRLLRFLLDRELVASVSFEMLDTDNDGPLSNLERQHAETLDSLKNALQWDEQGWDWSYYGPLIAEPVAAGVEVKSANISSARVSEVYASQPDPEIAGVLDADALEQLNSEIDASHCNMLPTSQFPAMVRVQQARDRQMALSLGHRELAGKLNVLVAGNYHVRRDLGVPRYLVALRPGVEPDSVVSLALLEVSPESEEPEDYLQAFSDELPFDYIWFTPAISDEDYCASLAR